MNGYPLKTYGVWAGNPEGTPYDPNRCADMVFTGFRIRQCSRKPGHGDRGLFCKQHAKQHPAKED